MFVPCQHAYSKSRYVVIFKCVNFLFPGLQYRLHPVLDGSYGYKKSDGTWDGMIGDVVSKVWPLTI